MKTTSSPSIPPNGRLIAAGMAAAGAIGLILHFMAQTQGTMRLMILLLAPLALFLGVGGTIEPRIVWSVGKYGQHLPAKYKLLGVVLAGLGVAVTLILVFFVYPMGLAE